MPTPWNITLKQCNAELDQNYKGWDEERLDLWLNEIIVYCFINKVYFIDTNSNNAGHWTQYNNNDMK